MRRIDTIIDCKQILLPRKVIETLGEDSLVDVGVHGTHDNAVAGATAGIMCKEVQCEAKLAEVEECPNQFVPTGSLESGVEEPRVANLGHVLEHIPGAVAVREAAEGPGNGGPSEGVVAVEGGATALVVGMELGEEFVARDVAELGRGGNWRRRRKVTKELWDGFV
jgi:hypothetical protein